MRLRKTYDVASFKALPDLNGQTGRFEAIVSMFGNVDLQGDRVMPGAFTKSLEKWRTTGDPIPIIWSHDWADPMAHIGYANAAECEEVPPGARADGAAGLLVRGQLDVHKPFAAQVYDLLKARRVKEWSFAYDVLDDSDGGDGATNLNVLDLIEAGPTLKGANPETVTLGVKADLEALERAAAVERKTPSAIFAAAMDLDPGIAKMLQRYEEVKDADKTATKPWHIEKRGDQYCVIKDSDDSNEGCHDTRAEAEAHMRALYANESSRGSEEKAMLFEHQEQDGQFCCVNSETGDTVDCHDSEQAAMDHCATLNQQSATDGEEKSAYLIQGDSLTSVTYTDEDGLKSAIETFMKASTDPANLTPAEAFTTGTGQGEVIARIDSMHGPYPDHVHSHSTNSADSKAFIDNNTSISPMTTTIQSNGTFPSGTADKPNVEDVTRGTKAGRVIGAKRVADLKSALGAAVEEWAAEVNQAASADEAKATEEPDPVLEELKSRIDALTGGSDE